MFYSLEGLHGVGKSSVAPELARALNAILMPTVPAHYNELRRSYQDISQLNARYLFFMAALADASIAIEAEVAKGNPVVVESYFYRTMAFHQGMGATICVTLPEDIIMPTEVFHLVCDEEVRQARIAGRMKSVGMWDRLAESRSAETLAAYANFPMHSIDTTTHDHLGVVRDILAHTEEVCRCENPQPVGSH